jgi:DNA-binding response OmpR family regulator
VPSAPKTSAEPATSPSILLIEDYDAIATAISSALKRFAPRHTAIVAHSLAEAQKITKKTAPDLFVIDFDPGYRGLTEFLEQMRETYPDAKVLVIAPGVSAELAAERRSFGALQFLEKPFDVADFGAAVQALLGPWKEPDSTHSRGTLRSLNVADVILLQCAGGRSVTIEAKTNNRKTGEIHVRNGQLSHAETGKHVGVDALEEMLSWSQVRIAETTKPPSRRRTIKEAWETVFLEACRQAQAQQPARIAPAKTAGPAKETAAKPQLKSGKKIVVIDDTEMLLIFVEDVLATTDPDLQITTALNGTSGIKAIERIIPDLVLLDYSLPDFNGDEVCRRLLANEQTAPIPVLMMSGHVAEMSQAAATLENVVATIEKPFLSEALSTLVEQTLKAGRRPAAKKISAPVKKTESPAKAPPAPATRTPEPSQTTNGTHAAAEPGVIAVQPIPTAQPTSAPPSAEPVPSPAPVAKPSSAPSRSAPPTPPPVQVPQPPAPPPPRPKPVPPPVQVSKPATPPSLPVQVPLAPQIDVETPAAVGPELRGPRGPTISLPVASTEPNDVVLGLFLEVVSMQLTESLRMGAIRAKPSSGTVSLHVASPALRAAFPANGFQLGPVEIDKNGRIVTLRLIPTLQPFTPLQTRNALQIGGVAVVPANAREHVELKSNLNAPMRMQLLVHLELTGVELSNTFQVSQLVLRSRARTARVTFSSQSIGQEETGATCEAAGVKLDASARIAELLLHPTA